MSVSLKMDKIEYRSVIKLFVKEGLTPNEIYSKFIKVYGDASPSFSTIKKWVTEFKRILRTGVSSAVPCNILYRVSSFLVFIQLQGIENKKGGVVMAE